MTIIPDPVTPDWLRKRLAEASITQAEAARLCESADRTMRSWCIGEREMPRACAILLEARLCLRAGNPNGALGILGSALPIPQR
jgi:hypothetical protein